MKLKSDAKVRRILIDSKEFAIFFADLLRHPFLFATDAVYYPIFLSQTYIFQDA